MSKLLLMFWIVLGSLAVTACGLGRDSSPVSGAAPGETPAPGGNGDGGPVTEQPPVPADYNPLTDPTPRALCGPGAQPETGLQGQISSADRISGRSAMGYWCNLQKVGQFEGEGASWQMDYYDDCAYYNTRNSPDQKHAGTVVVDVSDPLNPVATDYLTTPAMLDPWESLKTNQKRGLLAAVHGAGGAGTPFSQGPELDIYDLKDDCRYPKLASSTVFDGTIGHEGEWAPDGMTFYGTNTRGTVNLTDNPGQVNVFDVTDPSQPKLLTQARLIVHGLSISDDGNRAYCAAYSNNGFSVVDTSSIQSRSATPLLTQIGAIVNPDGALPQHTIPVVIKGKPYLITAEEALRGAVRILDISNETLPTQVARLRLQVHMPEQIGLDAQDGGTPTFVYDGHYCSVPQRIEPEIAVCGFFESGIRVFDIRDPLKPREIAYYMPPAISPDKVGAGSQHGGGTADRCTAQTRFVKERGEIWTTCQDNGFLVLRFTNGVWPFRNAASK